MSKELVITNAEDQYILDANKAAKVQEWLLKRDANNVVESFCNFFADDFTVQCYKEGTATLERLQFHIAAIESGLPVKDYFAIKGITQDYLLDKLRGLIETADDKTKLGAINTAFKYLVPDEKPVRITKAQQINNTFNLDAAEQKKKVEAVFAKIEKLAAQKSD